ncbi:hypothetical protein NDU88_007893, partial [Pleurodeles waltl]
AEHRSLFNTHHLHSQMPEVGPVHILSCQTQHVWHLTADNPDITRRDKAEQTLTESCLWSWRNG